MNEFMVRGIHRPVLLGEVMHFLGPGTGDKIIDATIGGGGHAEEILKRIRLSGTLIGIDRDSESLEIARNRLKALRGSVKLVNKNFKYLREITKTLQVGEVDGILFDLGISSIQLESRERGFSIKNPGPLDMRMDRNQGLTAKAVVNTLSERELSHVLRDFGEERFHKRIARALVVARKRKKIETTTELVEIIYSCLPYKKKWGRIHPATRTFQALRIRVNDELEAIEEALKETPYILKKGGRVCVISFHSLEDRIVKNVFRELGAKGVFHILTKKPVTPKEEEVLKNPRARSAKLRAAIKL